MNLRLLLKWSLCLTGAISAGFISSHKTTRFDPSELAPKKAAIRVRAGVKADVSAVQSKKILPLKSLAVPKEKRLPKVEPLVLDVSNLPSISQPSLALPELPAIPFDNLPPVPSSVPESAPNTVTVSDTPGGDVLVLALVLNDQAIVVDSRIIVPSDRPLEDLTMHFAALGQKWTGIEPPLQPGERRVLEVRIQYKKTPSTLP